MKNLIISTIVLLVALVSIKAQNKVKGNGDVVTKTRTTSDYDRIHLTGSRDVVLVKGKEGKISISGESNIIEHITTEVHEGTLKISTKKKVSLYPKKSLVITVPVSDISAVSLTGSGSIQGKDMVKSEILEVNLTGSWRHCNGRGSYTFIDSGDGFWRYGIGRFYQLSKD